ncbi:MAG TPA: hypothetical protein VHN16_10855 [Streptosporangiaceae bacterium]|nr:hypothetical protein [Streptosporangiaceae bacterium]
MTYRSAPPGSAPPGAASRPADGRVRKVRAALVVLFPETPEPSPRPGPGPAAAFRSVRQPLYVAIQVAAVFAGTIVLLLRIANVPAWDTLYAEDQGVYLFDALARPWHLLVPYGGYEEFVPRLIGQLISYLPLADVAAPFALAGAGIAALCALFIYHAMDGWIGSRWLRALVAAALILLPLAPIEVADSTVGSPWYVLTALFFGLLWRPKGWAGMTAAALVAFVAGSSEILVFIYAPLVLLRVVALPRWREHAVTAGWLAGMLVQVPVVLESYAQHTQRVAGLASPVRAVGFYFHNVALRAFGWRVSQRLVEITGLGGATVIVCAILAVGFGLALVTGSRQVRVFVAVALIMGFVQTVVAVTLSPYVINQRLLYDFEGGSRYSTMPIMAMTAAAVVAVDAFLRRQAMAHGGDRLPLVRQSPRVVAAVTALALVLTLGWLSDYRYGTEHSYWGYWRPRAEHMLAVCEHSTSGEITTWTWYHGRITIPCSNLRR